MGTKAYADASENNQPESPAQKFSKIDGIKGKTAEALYQLGNHSYADLVQFLSQRTARQVSEELKKLGVDRAPGLIKLDSWISQARKFSELEKNPPAPSPETTETASPPAKPQPNPKPWDHEAQFIVSFDIKEDKAGKLVRRTTVYNEKNAGEEMPFDGNDTAPWVNWILERVNLPFTPAPVTPAVEEAGEPEPPSVKADLPETPPAEAGEPEAPPVEADKIPAQPGEPAPRKPFDARLEIGNVVMSVIEPSDTVPEKRLIAGIDFRLSGADAEKLASQSIPFLAEIYTIDLEKGSPTRLVFHEGQLQPGQLDYSQQLEFAVPEVGHYVYHSLVRLLPLGDLIAFYLGPTLRVRP